MKADLYKLDGTKEEGAVELPAQIFEIEPNDHAIYLDVKAIQTNARQGTASTKNRARVRGGGRKPWRQKGRGMARAGSIRSPLWRGGGTVFGPMPHEFHMKVNKKVKVLARKSVYSYKAQEGAVKVVEDLQFPEPKTREFYTLLNKWELSGKKITLLLGAVKQDVIRSGRNLPNLQIRLAKDASTYDLLDNEVLLLEQSALETLQEVLKS
ncbi:MAG TPA: 50S ribosomal protein L4 [Bacteroidetes bacterium]|nr:50S ribosomal protein L4 [Bacteroidota bacterium]